jgi:hypothetical protein
MDFMKILKSIEELLYELISWVIFYPLTLWRIVMRPLSMLAYAERELQEEESKQFDDAVSPPILLLISLGVLHALEGVLVPPNAPSASGLLADDRNLLAFRAVLFSFFPFVFGLIQLKARGARITRATFKPVFYSQCYAAVPFVISISLGISILGYHADTGWGIVAGPTILIVGLIWYASTSSRWLAASARMPLLWAALITVAALICALPFFFIIGAIAGYAVSDGAI